MIECRRFGPSSGDDHKKFGQCTGSLLSSSDTAGPSRVRGPAFVTMDGCSTRRVPANVGTLYYAHGGSGDTTRPVLGGDDLRKASRFVGHGQTSSGARPP